MVPLHLHLFGRFAAHLDGNALAFARRKSAALLAYLALHPGPHRRESLAALLWPDARGDDARLSLRVTLADVRKAAGTALLLHGTEAVELHPDSVAASDCARFESLLLRLDACPLPQLQSALALYAAALLPDWADPWLEAPRQRLAQLHRAASLQLAGRWRSEGAYPAAIDVLRQLLRVDEADEAVQLQLIACLAAHGERDAALHQFELARQALAAQGVQPTAETLALADTLRRQAARSDTARLGNLPRPATSFVGREDELNEIETLMGQARLLTLTGTGGSGKTRLAIQAADEMAHDFDAGVYWVDLAPLADGALLHNALAKVLGVKPAPDQPLAEAIAKRIGGERLLLILDNCEHLLGACAACVHALLGACAGLRVLATSRAGLQVPGEVVWPTPALPLPPQDMPNPHLYLDNAALLLFSARAQTADSGFRLSAANAATVAAICRRLGGLPLAIELAAAQADRLSAGEILQGLAAALDLANPGNSGRHATLRAAIDWGVPPAGAGRTGVVAQAGRVCRRVHAAGCCRGGGRVHGTGGPARACAVAEHPGRRHPAGATAAERSGSHGAAHGHADPQGLRATAPCRRPRASPPAGHLA